MLSPEEEQDKLQTIKNEMAKIHLLIKTKEIEDIENAKKARSDEKTAEMRASESKERERLSAIDFELNKAEQATRILVEDMLSSKTDFPKSVMNVLANFQSECVIVDWHILLFIFTTFSFHFSGCFATLKRGQRYNSDTATSNFNELSSLTQKVERILSILLELKVDMAKLAYKVDMAESSVHEFFPLKSADDLDRFMDVGKGNFEKRKSGLYDLLLTVVSPNASAFSQGLINALFDSSYIKNYRWPSPK